MFDSQLRVFDAHVFIDGQAIGGAGVVARLGGEVELDCIDPIVAFP